MALADNVSQGFDGYQSRDDYPDDPASALEVQARAIWYALQHDFALKYINPPPTFSEYSQRLRTPSDILKGGRGTCIDLTLVLTACFEYIGLRPVIFLMKGHAFVGYWNDEDRHDEFRTTKDEPLLSTADNPTPLPSDRERLEAESFLPPSFLPLVEWQFDERRRKQIVHAVQRGDLVAIEATYLTNGGGFADACEVGAASLDNEQEFESMIDITLAREKGVTPLPLVEPPVGLPVTLMHPTLAARPFHRQGWISRRSMTGGGSWPTSATAQVWLLSRTHRDQTRRFPALAAAIAALAPPTLILDGEVVIFDAQLISRVEWLRQRPPEARGLARAYPVRGPG